jgi:hypothetical protein
MTVAAELDMESVFNRPASRASGRHWSNVGALTATADRSEKLSGATMVSAARFGTPAVLLSLGGTLEENA